MKILLVDDHTLVRDGLKLILGQLDETVEVDEAETCDGAIEHASATSYDLVLLDLKMPGVEGLEAVNIMRERFPDQPVVVLSGEAQPRLVRDAIEAGCMGFIPKTSTQQVFTQALKLVLAGGVYLPPAALSDAGSQEAPRARSTEADTGSAAELSRRQLEVLRCVIEGKPNKVIARELDVSEHTVKAHLSAVFRAFGVHNRTEAVYAAAQRGTLLK